MILHSMLPAEVLRIVVFCVCFFTVSLIVGLVVMAVLIRVLNRIRMQQAVRADGPESHLKKSGTLTTGGIGIFITTVLMAFVLKMYNSEKTLIIFAAALFCFVLGFADDFSKFRGRKTEGIKARWRFLMEILLGLALGYYAWSAYSDSGVIWLPGAFKSMDIGWIIIPFAAIAFVGTLNAVNFTDGLDGLLSGCALTTVGVYIFTQAFSNVGRTEEYLSLLIPLAGAIAAFLWFNAHPAKIFMGDTGSLFIGGVLGATAILTRSELFLFIVGFVYVAEALSVIIQVVSFRLTGKRVFRMAPIHHHFELAGWAETQVVTRFWIFSALCACVGIWLFFR